MLASARPTLTAHDTANRQTKYAQGGTPLTMAVSRALPRATLQSRDYRSPESEDSLRSRRKAEEGWSSNLNDEVRAYPTLTSRDYRSGADLPSRHGAVSLAKLLTYPTPTANRRSGLQSHGKNALLGQLSAEWCEMMMGFPPGWTDIGTSGPRPSGYLNTSMSQLARAQAIEVVRLELRRLEMRSCRKLHSCSLRQSKYFSKKQIAQQVKAELKRRRIKAL